MTSIGAEYITIIIIIILSLFFLKKYMLNSFNNNQIENYAPYMSCNTTKSAADFGSSGDRISFDKPCQTCDNIKEPSYLNPAGQQNNNEIYAQQTIDRQAHQIKNLRSRVYDLANQLDDQGNMFYRRKLNNKNYKPKPFLAYGGNLSMMNLNDDDFSNKTLSTIKFLSQTRESKYYGNEVHFPTELCGDYCSTSDPNRIYNAQIDTIRPIIFPTTKIQK